MVREGLSFASSSPVRCPGYPVANIERARSCQPSPVTDGHVIIIGGAEEKVRDRVILSRFASLAGGRDGTVVVISTASSLGELAGERYKQVLGELGVKKVRAIHAITRRKPTTTRWRSARGTRPASS